MVSLSNSRLPAAGILGQTLWSRCLTLDRGRPDPRNVLAVVDVISPGLYLSGTQKDLLERLYTRSEFTAADNNFIEAHDVPSFSLSLGSSSMITSGSKHGFVSCHCKRYCIDIKCESEKYEVSF
jgi:hypothetical protein